LPKRYRSLYRPYLEAIRENLGRVLVFDVLNEGLSKPRYLLSLYIESRLPKKLREAVEKAEEIITAKVQEKARELINLARFLAAEAEKMLRELVLYKHKLE